MKMENWAWMAALVVGSSPLDAQIPTKKAVRVAPVVPAPQIAAPSNLSKAQLLNRIRTATPMAQAAAQTSSGTSSASASSGTSAAPAPTIVERETLTTSQMTAGASKVYFRNVTTYWSGTGATIIQMDHRGSWTIAFRGSGNPYAIDCRFSSPDTDVAYSFGLAGGRTTDDVQGETELIGGHIVTAVPRFAAGQDIRVNFNAPVSSSQDALLGYWHSCQIFELA